MLRSSRVLVFVPIALLAGCASQSPRLATVPASFEHSGAIVTDGAYVSAVEREARRRGLQVQWVNPPLRRVPSNE